MSLSRKGLIFLIGLLTLQIGLGAALYDLHRRTQEELARITESLRLSDKLCRTLTEISLVRRAINGQDVEALQECEATLGRSLEALIFEYKGPAEKLSAINDAHTHLLICNKVIERAKRLIREGNFTKSGDKEIYPALRENITAVVRDTSPLIAVLEEQQTTTQRALKNEESMRELNSFLICAGIALEILLIGLAYGLFTHDVARRMGTIIENTNRISQQQPLLPKVEGTDEISRLDLAFHKLASVLSTADREARILIEKQRDVICRLDRDLEFIHLNPACQTQFGLSPEELVHRHLADLIHPDDSGSARERFEQSIFAAQPPFEVRVVHPDKSVSESLWSVRWSAYSQSFLCIAHDITAQKQAERLRQEVLQMVGHDLKSPLTTVSGFLQLMQTPNLAELTPPGRAQVEDGLVAADQMSTLIKALLNLEMIRAGMFTLQRERIPLSEIITSATETAEEDARRSGVLITKGDTNLEVYADKERLEQALHCFLANAIKRSKRGSEVIVKADRAGDAIHVGVTDTGSIIAQELLQHIFEPFHANDANHRGSSNLSMALCKAIVELHGGRISAQSMDGWTAFAFELPVQITG
jgi:PAS domain S-box-containing protein